MHKFSNIEQEILKQISEANESLKIAVTWFTNHVFYHALAGKLRDSSFNLEIIVLNDRINNKNEGINFQELIDLGAKFYYSDLENMVHHKFCIVDEKCVITGSYNWTYYAENRNWENIVILNSRESVNAFKFEFDRLIKSHKLITNIKENQKLSVSINSNDYLITDYIFQAQHEKENGDDLIAGKIYSELLKLNRKDEVAAKAQNQILSKYNSNEEFNVSPYEIGIEYKTGYNMAIPAFEKLPFSVVKGGKTVMDNQTSVLVKVQKFDVIPKTIFQFTINNLRPSPSNTEKVKYIFNLEKDGTLTVICKEVGGTSQITKVENIKKWL